MGLTPYTRLSAVVSAIAADAGQNSETAPQTSITTIGQIEAARRLGPPRVTWVVGGGPVTDPEQDETELSKIGYQRNPACRVAFLGSSYDQAEGLLYDFLAAVRRTQQSTVVPGDEAVTPETITGANRYEISLEVLVKLPVPFETYTAADVDAAAQTGTVTNP
jgi:hypothetical protein